MSDPRDEHRESVADEGEDGDPPGHETWPMRSRTAGPGPSALPGLRRRRAATGLTALVRATRGSKPKTPPTADALANGVKMTVR